MNHTVTVLWSESRTLQTDVEVDEAELREWLTKHQPELANTPVTEVPLDVLEEWITGRDDYPGSLDETGTEIDNTEPNIHELRWAW